MAVYTKLSEEELKEFFSKYNLGNLLNYNESKKVLKILIILFKQKKVSLFLLCTKRELKRKIYLFL